FRARRRRGRSETQREAARAVHEPQGVFAACRDRRGRADGAALAAREHVPTFLTLLGIVIGVGSVVTMLAIGEGAAQDIVERISSIGTDVLQLQPARAEGQRRNMPSTLTFDDADAILEGVPNVAYTLPELQGQQTVRWGRQD